MVETINQREEALIALLGDEPKRMFLDFVNAHSELNGILSQKNFEDGLRIGARLMMDIQVEA